MATLLGVSWKETRIDELGWRRFELVKLVVGSGVERKLRSLGFGSGSTTKRVACI
jgi:hypothetical protein